MLAAAGLLTLLAGFLVSDPFTGARMLALALVVLPWGVYVAVTRPMVVFGATALVLAFLPFGVLPGTSLPLVLMLGAGTCVAALLRPGKTGQGGLLGWAMVVLIVLSTISVMVTYTSSYDLIEFAKWLVASTAGLSLLRLSGEERQQFGRLFVYGSIASAVLGMFGVVFDQSGRYLAFLAPFGYLSGAESLRFVFGATEQSVRLTGTYIDPNAAGLFLFIALFLSVALLRGPLLVLAFLTLLPALALTLSRAAIFSAVVALLLFLAMQNMRLGGRMKAVGLGAGAGAALFAVPDIQSRIFESFGSSDAGSTARAAALRDFPRHLEGHWFFGLGWGRIEFRDGEAAFLTNYVANAPLLTVYRGGLLTGLAFCAVLLIGVTIAFKTMRSREAGPGLVAAGFCGLVVVALQLDFPVVTIPPVTMVFSMFIAFLVPAGFPDQQEDAEEPVPGRAGGHSEAQLLHARKVRAT